MKRLIHIGNTIFLICFTILSTLASTLCMPVIDSNAAGDGIWDLDNYTTNEWSIDYLDPSKLSEGAGAVVGGSASGEGYYYVFTSLDKNATTSTIYRTIGFVFSRCVAGGKTRSEPYNQNIILPITDRDGEYKKEDYFLAIKTPYPGDSSKSYNTWFLSVEKVKAFILLRYGATVEQEGSWAYDIDHNSPSNQIYLGLDGILTVVKNNVPQGYLYDMGNYDCGTTGTVYTDTSVIQTYATYHDYNEMSKIFPNNMNSIRTHFGKALPLLTEEVVDEEESLEPEPEIVEDAESSFASDLYKRFKTYASTPTPAYVTYNDSRAYTDSSGSHAAFDLSQGIPTKEKLVNGLETDGFYGTVDIGKHEVTNTKWNGNTSNFKYTYIYYTSRYTYTDSAGKRHYKTIKHTGSGTTQVSRKAAYYYIWDMDLYDFEEANTTNEAYANNLVKYAGTDSHKMAGTMTTNRPVYDATINGNKCGTNSGKIKISSWKPVNEKHITWKQVDMNLGTIRSRNYKSVAKSMAESRVGNSGFAKVKNDYLKIADHLVLDNTEVTANNPNNSSYLKEPQWMNTFDTETYETTPEYNKQMVTIPATVANGPYLTSIDDLTTNAKDGVVYRKQFITNGEQTVGFAKGTTDGSRIKSTFAKNEPVIVHTPVVSPVKIYDKDGNEISAEEKATQLISESTSAAYQLRLDNDYSFKFVAQNHLQAQGYKDSSTLDNAWEGTDNKYDKYVKNKWVHFPFTVRMQGRYIEPQTDPNNSKYWIKIQDLSKTEFYIPTWAIENVYSGGNSILYKVESCNVIDENDADHSGAQEPNANLNRGNYVATYQIPVQVSGWIYDFQIVGTNDRDTFAGYEQGYANAWYAFCKNKEEKKGGQLNRVGDTSVRYTVDGTLTNNWKKENTIALSNGSSLVYKNMGSLLKGNSFAYSVRTIANLDDENGDQVIITPIFRYVTKDGVEKTNVDIYFHDDSTNNEELYIKYSSHRDNGILQKTNLGMSEFEGSYYKDDLNYTASERGVTTQNVLNTKVDSYNLSSIILNSKLRLLTGNNEQLRVNLENAGSAVIPFDDLGDVESDYNTTYKNFRHSMQTWYGTYYIPSSLFVTDHHADVNGEDYIHWYAGQQAGIKEDDDIWYKDGYLILNFDIKTVNNNEPHLRYLGGASDEWNRQGRRTQVTVGDKNDGTEKTIPIRPGDVAVVDMSGSVKDKYDAKIFMIK